ncbi:MAG: hypothetical protein L6Q71_01125 [Planctomycetes bacterium]|nr:hypothetical protein [Planctomycetota bacterium]
MARKKKGGGSRGGSPWYLAMFTGLFALIAGAVMLLVRLLLKILPEREWWAALFASRRFRLHASVVLSFVLFMAGLRLMRGHLEAQERYVIDPSRITLSTGAITWAEGESRTLLESMISNDLYQRLSNLPQSHAFDDEILASVAQKLKASPWVSSVERIERHFPAEQVSSCLAVSLKIRNCPM